jgi:hypothetical protein
MSAKNASGTVLIREDTILPAGLALESEAFLDGWRIVRGTDDAYGLGRKIEKAHWNFFYLTGETNTIVLGQEKPGTLRRAVKQLLAKREGQTWNSLQITSVASKRFLGIPFLSVTANYRHMQESLYLIPAWAGARTPVASTPEIELNSNERRHPAETHTTEHPAEA